jgi:colicin import membrane protein
MSTVIETHPSFEELRRKYFYGWRDVQRLRDDGTTYLEHIPLTLEDTLHPQLGDYIVEGPMHDQTRDYLGDVFRARLANDPSAFVLSDCGVYWDHPDFGHHCPDIAVLTGLTDPKRILAEDSYKVKKFGKLPRMIVEIVSRHVRNNDVVVKFQDYHTLEVPLYVIVDREKSDVDWKIVPYQYAPSHYVPLATDERGRFWIDFLGIWLGVEDQKVVCYDGKTGCVIGDYVEVTRKLETEKQRTEEEKHRAETEKYRAETEKQRAETEKQRAETEKQRAEIAETKLKEMEAELARLRAQ